MPGNLDDLLHLPLLVALTVRLIPGEVLVRSRSRTQNLWEKGFSGRWYHTIPVVLVWFLVIWLIIRPFL